MNKASNLQVSLDFKQQILFFNSFELQIDFLITLRVLSAYRISSVYKRITKKNNITHERRKDRFLLEASNFKMKLWQKTFKESDMRYLNIKSRMYQVFTIKLYMSESWPREVELLSTKIGLA